MEMEVVAVNYENFLDDEITCPEFYDVYRDPQEVNSDPSFQQMEQLHLTKQRERIEIEIEKLKQQHPQGMFQISKTECDMCGKPSIKYRCKECDRFMCDQCQTSHAKIKLNKSHEVTSVTQLVQPYKSNMRTTIAELQHEISKIDEYENRITVKIHQLDSLRRNQIDKVKQFTREAIESLQENEQNLIDLINDVTHPLSNQFLDQKQLFKESKENLKQTARIHDEIIQSEDFVLLQNCIDKIQKNISRDINESRAFWPQIVEIKEHPTNILLNRNALDVKDYMKIEIIDKFVLNYSAVSNKKFVYTASADAGHYCYKLCEINGQIWCGGVSNITVYNKQCEKLKTITGKHDLLSYISGIAPYGHNQVIVAARSGLHEIDIKDHYNCTCITKGNYHDVCVHGGEVYGLEWENQKVVVCSYGDRWQEVRQIQLAYGENLKRHRLSVSGTAIYTSSWNNKCVHKYNTEGQLIDTITKDRGRLLLCDVDDYDNYLVLDYDNRTVHVVHNNTWRTLSLIGYHWQLKFLFYALLDTNGALWIGTHNSTIIKYVPLSPDSEIQQSEKIRSAGIEPPQTKKETKHSVCHQQ